MDVRCERCLTEYELEDDAVSDTGTDVQCTACGHTFVVAKPAATGAHGRDAGKDGPPPPADWLLETPDGQVHRLRNLNSLQRWIIERKVTREDRISKIGHGWRQLGEIVELGAFFDVVDEADRARAGRAATGGLAEEAAQARQAGLRRTPSGPVTARRDPARRALTPLVTRKVPMSSDADAELPALRPPLEARSPRTDTELVRVRPRGARTTKVAVGLAVIGVVTYVGVRLARQQPQTSGPAEDATMVRSGAAPADRALPSASRPTPAEPLPALASSAASGEAPSGGVAAASGEAPGAGVAATRLSPGDSVPASLPPAETAARTRRAAEEEAAPRVDRPADYAALVAEADRALENGARAKAAKLYDRALAVRPGGAEATTGVGYVMLDRGRPAQAILSFQRAIAAKELPAAVFGLAEAKRALGKTDEAIAAYQRYLAIAPRGTDAPAARRQVKALSSAGDAD